jgi:hypothetical protein
MNAHLAASTPLVVNAVNPGYCYSELRRKLSPAMRFVDSVMERCLALTTEVGSRRLVWSAVGEQRHPETLRGEYINAYEREKPSDFVVGPDGVKAEERLCVLALLLIDGRNQH